MAGSNVDAHSKRDAMKAGIDNLLFNCMEAGKGQSLLIISERDRGDYYSGTLANVIAAHARARELNVEIVSAPFVEDTTRLPDNISAAMESADNTLFLSRIGDQLRFTNLIGKGTKTICYALDEDSFRTAFCSADHRFFVALKHLVNSAIWGERKITLTCPSGTHLVGTSPPDAGTDDMDDVTMNRFPMTVFRPVPAKSFSGTVALTRWLCATGSRFYQPDSVLVDGVVYAEIESGRITAFDGDSSEVSKVQEHYDYVAQKYAIERDVVHSWHAGFHPQNGYSGLAIENLTRWSGSAFGNPRYLHFHTCGDFAPGEICISVFDPTVTVDGIDLWRRGKFVFAETPQVQALMDRYPGIRELYSRPIRDFGLAEDLESGI